MNGKLVQDYYSFKNWVKHVVGESRKQSTFLIGIDGCGGSGKSTFAQKLKDDFCDVTIVHMDDFYVTTSLISNLEPAKKSIGADFDWRRLLKEVLNPLSKEVAGYYQRYDWKTDKLAEWHHVPVGGIVVIEGVYTLRKELEDLYDVKVWIDCPRETRLARGIERDGEDAQTIWENNWMIAEDLYVKAHQPVNRANFIIRGY
ncbi:uridine kinase [Niallia taxi]|uniref:uridine kinase family protein n=1 Tax=Niallia taxi TaxID=2499688 RepID=UPI00203EFA77|nr:uridine kinase [Niallia taxi]MCM3213008.1 uridine kinase [Niallia taxi]